MAPEARQRPPAPLIRRLLLHALQPGRHAHFALAVFFPARQLLPVLVQHDQSGQVAGPGHVLDAHFAGKGSGEVCEWRRPVGVVCGGAADAVGCAVGVCGGRIGRGGGGKCNGGDVTVRFGRVRFAADHREPIYGAVFMRMDT